MKTLPIIALAVSSVIFSACVPETTTPTPSTIWYVDADGDGFGDENDAGMASTNQSAGYVADNTDCDDTAGSGAEINPDATDFFSGIDENCDGNLDNITHHVFTTSESFSGDIVAEATARFSYAGSNGLEAADSICQQLADNSQFMQQGIYKAWLSDSSSSPSISFTKPTVNYVKYSAAIDDYQVVASGWIGFTSSAIDNPMDKDELGMILSPLYSWTGTIRNGASAGYHCDDWTDSTGSAQGEAGWVGSVYSSRTATSVDSCSAVNQYHLYCVQQ